MEKMHIFLFQNFLILSWLQSRSQVPDAILSSPHLEHCRTRVRGAHCEILPKWANGAKLLIPFTERQRDDLAAVGKELRGHHIVALHSNVPAIQAAFANGRKRPKIQGDKGSLT